jgi:1-acyl-sn-glycerol-3-phosphate acyltransferase
MSNHESNLDPPALLEAIPVPVVFLAKEELKWVPLVGWVCMAAGIIFIDRGRSRRALASIKRAAREIRNGRSVLLFPEGTRTRTGLMGPFKKGGFALAMDARVPIVPMAAVGGYHILPAATPFLRKGRYAVRFGQPVNPQDFESRDALLQEVRQRILGLCAATGTPAAP